MRSLPPTEPGRHRRFRWGMAVLAGLAWLMPLAATLATTAEPPAWVTPPVSAPGVTQRIFQSAAVGGPVSYHVYLPDAYAAEPQRRFPVLYWLHGCGPNPQSAIAPLSAAFKDAIARGRIPPLILVFPNGLPCGMYTDAVGGRQPVASMIVNDLLPEVDGHLRTLADRRGRIIEGFSMGGYGAARLGLMHPQRFGAVSILGGGPLQADFLAPEPGLQPLELRQRLLDQIWGGSPAAFLADSPRTIASKAATALPNPLPIRQMLGDADFTLPANREFHALLNSLGIAHTYREVPGVEHAMSDLMTALGDDYWAFFAEALVTAPTTTTTQADASRLLTQASFGARWSDIERIAAIGAGAWIDEQIAAPATLHLDALDTHYNALLPLYNLGPVPESSCVLSTLCRYARRDVWWRTAITAPDQLRQRVAFALSQFFVISDLNADVNYTQYAPADFYDTLVIHAFGDFRTLLKEVSLHPAMGRYLGMLQNEKADPSKNTEPDENYAREVMQLFSIGLSELNPDGSVKTDAHGAAIPTYGDPEITAFARVFTGWNFANATRWKFNSNNAGIPGYIDAMRPMEPFHDTGSKTLLRGQVLAPDRTATADLDSAIDNLANHSNVGPFLARHLIQRLVTSNPTPAYIGRVAAVFADNGRGQRGDLAAVVRAVLLDAEARDPSLAATPSYGKLREPLLRYTALWRAFTSPGVAVANGAGRVEGIYRFHNSDSLLAQAPLSAPSVFNFYRPNFRRPGEIRDLGLFSPEFQILNDNTAISMVNQLHAVTFNADLEAPGVNRMLTGPLATLGSHGLDLRTEKALAVADPAALVDRLNLLLMGGAMSPAMRTLLVDTLRTMPPGDGGRQRTEDALFLVLSSPQFAIQR